MLSSTTLESLNARYRQASPFAGTSRLSRPRWCLYLVIRSLDPEGSGRQRWTMGWRPALTAFAIIFGDRMPKAENH